MVEIGWLATMLLCFEKWYDRAGMVEVLGNWLTWKNVRYNDVI
jgi:hypothetical protein